MRFTKIMTVLGGALLLGATLGGAMIADNLKNTSNPAIVYGESAANSDFIGASNILNGLNSSIITTNETTLTGEVKAIETSSQPLYLGDLMNDTKTTFTKEQLPTVLADGVITDEAGKDYDYNLRVAVPNSKVLYGETADNLDPPVIYADFNSQSKYEMRIIFPTAIDPSLFADEKITLFGKTYTFSSNEASLSNTSITLFENSQSVTLNDGEDLVAGNNTLKASVEDATHAIIYVNGVSKNVKEGFAGKINGVDVYVRDIYGPDYISSTRSRYVELYINADSLVLENNQEVKIASDEVAGTTVNFVQSGTKVSEIRIAVTPYNLDKDIRYLKEKDSFVDPVFKSLRFTLQGVNPTLENDTRDLIELGASTEDRLGITFTNRLNKEYDLDILIPSSIMLDANYNPMYNSTCTTNSTQNVLDPLTNITSTVVTCTAPGTWTYNATTLGVEQGKKIIVEKDKQIQKGDYFVTTSGEYSQVWRLENIKSDGKVEVKDATGGETTTLSIGFGSTGSLSLADGSSATIGLMNSTAIVLKDKASNIIYTYRGAKIILPTDNSGKIQLVEETSYNGGDFHDNAGASVGNTLNFEWAYKKERSGRDIFLKGVNYGTKDVNYWTGNVGDNDIYSITKYGTYIQQLGNDDKRFEINYPENAMKVNLYIGELNSIETTTTSNSKDLILVRDSSSDYLNRNIIVVGGSCINSVAATLLGETTPLCGDDFTAKTNVTAGHYLIQTFQNPWASDKVAILVAGYNAEDTTKAVNDILTNSTLNFTVGSKIIV